MTKPQSRSEWVRDLGLFTVIVVDVVGYTGAGIALGYLAWQKAGMPWWVLLISSITGLSLAMYRIYLMTRKSTRSTEGDPEKKS